MSGKARPSLRKKTLENVRFCNLSQTDKECIFELFRRYEEMSNIVRCKDCEYWQDNNGGYPHSECRWGKDETPDADDYCSFGVRKDDNK